MNNLSRKDLDSLVKRGALFVANHSGGKDSMACLIKLSRRVPLSQIIVVHASLGAMEWPGALEKAQEHAQSLGLPFFVAKANKSLFDMVVHRRATRPDAPSWPSASNRQCTSDLKRDPIAKVVRQYANAHGFTLIINCLGIRAEESIARGKRPAFSVNSRETNSKREVFEWLPIHSLKLSHVWGLISTQPVKRHYAYLLGNERLSCVFCIMASRNDLVVGQRHNPELFNQYVALEKQTGYTMHQSRESLLELVLGKEYAQAA